MSSETAIPQPDDPNEVFFIPPVGWKYLSTRVVVHNGVPIAFSLRKEVFGSTIAFDYSILNPSPEIASAQGQDGSDRPSTNASTKEKPEELEMLDSQGWSESPIPLEFPNHVRVIGQTAVPSLEFPAVDKTGQRTAKDAEEEKLDKWLSTTQCLTAAVTDFQVLSDTKYIYLFRQGIQVENEKSIQGLSVKFDDLLRFVNGNLLCDRFLVVGTRLETAYEVRYRRSGQRSVPLNDKDTLSVRDINENFFYEPTFSLPFIANLEAGRFTVLRVPTSTTGAFKWQIFAHSSKTKNLENYTVDVDQDGLFDLHGKMYYICNDTGHESAFSTKPGPCTALSEATMSPCGAPKIPYVTSHGLSEKSVSFAKGSTATIELREPIDFTSTKFSNGVVFEAWVRPSGESFVQKPKQVHAAGATAGVPSDSATAATSSISPQIPSNTADQPAPGAIEQDAPIVVESGNTSTDAKAAGERQAASSGGDEAPEDSVVDEPLLPKDSQLIIFGFNNGPNIVLDHDLNLALTNPNDSKKIVARTGFPTLVDSWNHIAVIFPGGDQAPILMVNDYAFESPEKVRPGTLLQLGSEGSTQNRFIGSIDEIRIWQHGLHFSTVSARSGIRTTGFEDLLEACWHLDEGEGQIAYDSSDNHHDLKLSGEIKGVWAEQHAPVVRRTGLSRRTLRLEGGATVTGGLHAAIYYEQVSASNPGGAKDPKEDKPLKRNARVLLGGIVAKQGLPGNRLMILDFGLMVDGSLSGSSGVLPLSSIELKTEPAPTATIPQLFQDVDGAKLFGGVLAFDQAAAYTDAPFIWESATGTCSIYFRHSSNALCSLSYNCAQILADKPPLISNPLQSKALKLSGSEVLTMLETSIVDKKSSMTQASTGLAFESWLKVASNRRSVICAYTSEKLSRSKGDPNEVSVFVLSVAPPSSGKPGFAFEINVNDQMARIDSPSLLIDSWVHFAASTKRTYALRFNGTNHVDLGTGPELNVADFSVLLNLELEAGGMNRDQAILGKVEKDTGLTPLELRITSGNRLQVRFWAMSPSGTGDASLRTMLSGKEAIKQGDGYSLGGTDFTFKSGTSYRVFVSKKMVTPASKTQTKSRRGAIVDIRIWSTDGVLLTKLDNQTIHELEWGGENDNNGRESNDTLYQSSRGGLPVGDPVTNGAALLLGKSPQCAGFQGKIAGAWLYGAALSVHDTAPAIWPPPGGKSPLGAWSFSSPDAKSLQDDLGHHHGKLVGKPVWVASPFAEDNKTSFYVNGVRTKPSRPVSFDYIERPAGPQQLTIGNVIRGDLSMRWYGAENHFEGELDEFRLWAVPRTRENITDALSSRLTEVSSDLEAYYSFDQMASSSSEYGPTFLDDSINCWHLTALHAKEPQLITSSAPVGHDASCVRQALSENGTTMKPISMIGGPGVAEYGDVTIGSGGAMEGNFKRMYAFVDDTGCLRLVTGFKIGSLVTEWLSQVQTAPTLIGYIEGAPPIPAENYIDRYDKPNSSVRFSNANRVAYTYSSRRENTNGGSLNIHAGGGAKWSAEAGFAIMTKVTSGEVKATVKSQLEWNSTDITNEVATATSHHNIDVKADLTGTWRTSVNEDGDHEEWYEPNNTGIALVESEVADLFALRLKLRGNTWPLVAYQMRPNPDIPKDRNLVTFKLNPRYTKQGCLDGRNGLNADPDFPLSDGTAPRDVSYYKPIEAYALRDQIRREEEKLAGEWEQRQTKSYYYSGTRLEDLPKRTKRNICNSYVWTADGGTFQETHSTMDFVQQEVSGSSSYRWALGGSIDSEIMIASALVVGGVDGLYNSHYVSTSTKEKNSDSSFELQTELPQPHDIRMEAEESGYLVKRPGSVDAYRWMSFYLDASTDATASFFNTVVDPIWLQSSPDSDAKVLQQLKQRLKEEGGDPKTKAWRVFHRCTYISRVPEPIPTGGAAAASAQAKKQEPTKKSVVDYSANWGIITALEPYIRPAESRSELAALAKNKCTELYPSLMALPKLWEQTVDMLAAYLGVDE